MINTLRITGVIAVLVAGVLFVFPVIYGVRTDQRVQEFLSSPGVRAQFEKAADNKPQGKEDRASPLVQQAEAFALYLNPPRPAAGAALRQEKTTGLPALPPSIPKFKVFVTSHCQNDPGLSLALIDEPGRGRRWVRPSSTVGHLIIDQIKDGIVVVKNNDETYEVPVEKNPAPAAATATSPAAAALAPRDAAMRSRGIMSAPAKPAPLASPAVATTIPAQPASPEKDAKLQELARQLIDAQRGTASGSSGEALSETERQARAQDLIAKYREAQRSIRVSPKEAKELGDLGKEPVQSKGDPNTPAASDSGKIEPAPRDPNASGGGGSAP